MKRRRILISLLMLAAFIPLSAQEAPRHEIHVGVGDMLYESAVFHDSVSKRDYRYTGHFFAGYQFNIKDWLGVGLDTDYEKVSWNEAGSSHNYSNMTLLPNVRFIYFRKGAVTMYSGFGIGVLVNTGTDLDYKGRRTVWCPAFGVTAYGISVGGEHVYGAFEIGGLNSFYTLQEVYMLGSRLFSLSIGVRL